MDLSRLFVYDRALQLVAACETVAARLPYFRRELSDQLRRASTSVALNVAEGAAEFSPKEKIRIYRIARRSAAECVAALDVVDLVQPGEATLAAREKAREVLALVTRTIQAVERRRAP